MTATTQKNRILWHRSAENVFFLLEDESIISSRVFPRSHEKTAMKSSTFMSGLQVTHECCWCDTRNGLCGNSEDKSRQTAVYPNINSQMYVVELVRELFRQLRGKSPFDFVSGTYNLADVNTRRKAKSFLATAYSRTILQRRSLKNTIVRTYNWLRNIDLTSSNLKTFSESSVKSVIANLANSFIWNNSEVISFYF